MITIPKIETDDGDVKMFSIDMDPPLNNLMQDQQYEVFAPFRAGDMLEIPSLIFVETRFISKQRAEAEMAQQRLNPGREATISTLNYESDLKPQIAIIPYQNLTQDTLQNSAPILNQRINITPTTPFPIIVKQHQQENYIPITPVAIKEIKSVPNPEPKKTFCHATVMATVVSKEFGTMTDAKNPTRDRGMQVKICKTNSIAIQCCIDDDLDFETTDEASIPDKTDKQPEENEYMTLLLYNCEKSLCYSNGKVECRVCGEVQSSLKRMEAHLVLHFGPKVLCFRCGIQFENKFDLQSHACLEKRRKRLPCPYYNCNAVAISKLELYDHLNEHTFEFMYKCGACKRKYFTVGELRLHLKVSKKCRKLKQQQRLPYDKKNMQSTSDRVCRNRVKIAYAFKGIKLMRISPLTRKSAIKHKCQLCFKVLSNMFKLKIHQKSCYLRYNIRYKWECLKAEE